MQHFFNGSAIASVDAKGRVALPRFVRATIEQRSAAATVVIGIHDSDPCLRAYDWNYAATLHADHERRRLAEADGDTHHMRARRIFGIVEEASYGAKGVITLPAMMRAKGGIEESALFVGAGGTFEIWNPQRALASDDRELRDLAAWRLEDVQPVQ